ncbi:hypothetical protein [Microcoleus vaginatus]|uniref:hypothetical protein n=1 Tax=Microcoleus vaginatus TaxID=119532 RepID=UPI00403F0B8E
MLTLTKHLPANPDAIVSFTLQMTSDDRTRSRHRFETDTGEKLHLSLPRGTVYCAIEIYCSRKTVPVWYW